jgi:ATP-dependent RNA helicase DeaD
MESNKFDDLNIRFEIKKGLKDMGLSEMFPIQKQGIPVLLEGNDLIGQAQTGTGKTIAFTVPMLEKLDLGNTWVQAIVLVPTRELAVQVYDEVRKIGKHMKANVAVVYGGVSIENQIKKIREGAQIIIGTPGRVLDHLERGTLNLRGIKMVVLDEADRMLDMGFIEDIRKILEDTPQHRQTMLFSATMPEPIVYLAAEYMKPEYANVSVSKDEITVKDIAQFYTDVDYFTKIRTLEKLFKVENIESAIIFCNTKIGVDKLVQALRHSSVRAEGIHGNLSQNQRNRIMEKFRAGELKVLVATDVAARGLDIKGVSHVINYNIPQDPKTYVHRIGRTGRAGKTGKAISFVSDRDIEAWGQIRWFVDMDIPRQEYLTKEEREAAQKQSHRPHHHAAGQRHGRPHRPGGYGFHRPRPRHGFGRPRHRM